MANKEQITRRKLELVAQLATQRSAITQSRNAFQEKVQEKLQFKVQAKQFLSKLISKKPKSLFAGSAVAGLAAALFLRRPRKVQIKKAPQSTRVLMLGWILALIKPAAKAWIIARAKEHAATQAAYRVNQPTAPRKAISQNGPS